MFWLKSKWQKWTNWQYWPAWFFYIYPALYYLLLAIKARSLFFYTGVNPAWHNAGMKGDSKWNIYRQLCKQHLPKTSLVKKGQSIDQDFDLSFPLVAKPDVGQRGKGIKLINQKEELIDYLQNVKGNTILQEYSTFKEEWGIFYVRYPGQAIGRISSLMQRDFWKVRGDGRDSLWQLAAGSPEWPMQYHRLKHMELRWKQQIPKAGEIITLEPIGNHNRGTAFLDKRTLISDRLVNRIEQLTEKIPHFYFGRLDIKINSLQDFLEGGPAHIIEINGFGAEPAHIYETRYKLCQAYRDVLYHIKLGYLIAMENKAVGHQFPDFMKGTKQFMSNEIPTETISSPKPFS